FQAEDGIRGFHVTGVQTCALPISHTGPAAVAGPPRRRPFPAQPQPGPPTGLHDGPGPPPAAPAQTGLLPAPAAPPPARPLPLPAAPATGPVPLPGPAGPRHVHAPARIAPRGAP